VAALFDQADPKNTLLEAPPLRLALRATLQSRLSFLITKHRSR
jgi:hypothetical protein